MAMLSSILFVLLALLGSVSQVTAQSATPLVAVVTPVAADNCTVEPRTAGAIAEIVTEKDIANATPLAEPAAYNRPEGKVADAETISGVNEMVRQLAACVNAGDFMRFLALFSNDGLRRYGAELGLPLDPDDPLLTPAPTINDQLFVRSIDDIILLSDGRVSALVHLADQTDSEASDQTLQLILVRSSTRWLIDEVIVILQPETSWMPVHGDGYDGVIVDAATSSEFVSELTGLDAAVGWEPTPGDIALLEASLPDFLKSAQGAASDLYQRLPAYKRQYAGYIDSDGRSMILVNALCDTAVTDWQSQIVIVMDGGDCFFHLSYETETGTFSDLSINGEA